MLLNNQGEEISVTEDAEMISIFLGSFLLDCVETSKQVWLDQFGEAFAAKYTFVSQGGNVEEFYEVVSNPPSPVATTNVRVI